MSDIERKIIQRLYHGPATIAELVMLCLHLGNTAQVQAVLDELAAQNRVVIEDAKVRLI